MLSSQSVFAWIECYADLQLLARRNVRAAAYFHADANAPAGSQRQHMPFAITTPSRENAMPGGPQTARHCSIINNSSADDTQSKAARILNRHAVVRLPAVPCPQTSAPQ